MLGLSTGRRCADDQAPILKEEIRKLVGNPVRHINREIECLEGMD